MKTTDYTARPNTADEMMVYFTSFGDCAPVYPTGAENSIGTTIESKTEKIDDKTFLNWQIQGLVKNCLFLIQRSVDAGPFETIEVKKGICGDPTLTVLYCFLDNEQSEGAVKYQVKQIELDPSLASIAARTQDRV